MQKCAFYIQGARSVVRRARLRIRSGAADPLSTRAPYGNLPRSDKPSPGSGNCTATGVPRHMTFKGLGVALSFAIVHCGAKLFGQLANTPRFCS